MKKEKNVHPYIKGTFSILNEDYDRNNNFFN